MLGLHKLSSITGALLLCGASFAQPFELNLFARRSVTLHDSKVEGSVAALGTIALTDYSVGSILGSDDNRCDVAAGGDLLFTRGSVPNGRICARGRLVLDQVGFRVQPINYVPNDLDLYYADADVLSRYFGEKAPDRVVLSHTTGTVLTLAGNHPRLNVFQVTAAALRAASGIVVVAPLHSAAMVNVLGDTVTLEKVGVTLSGVDAAHVLWNLPQATRLTVANAQIEGSVLAPQASLEFDAGQIHGSVTVLEASGNGFFKHAPYVGPHYR